jgi:PAS domain S-box-containing protein
MLKYFRDITWTDALAAVGVLLMISKFLKEVFGVDMVGRKIYRGAPLAWKWMIRSATDRKDMHNKLDRIVAECTYNSGTSLKDAVKRIENTCLVQTDMLRDLKSRSDMHSLRLDIADLNNRRMTYRMDKTGSCTFINDAYLKQFGYTERDILGHNWESIIHEDDLEEVQQRWKRAIEIKGRYYSEHRIYDGQGDVHRVCSIGYPVVIDEQLQGFYGTADEITESAEL